MSVWAWNTRNLVGSNENTTKYLKPIAMLSMVVSHVVTSSCPVGVVGISPFHVKTNLPPRRRTPAKNTKSVREN